jgi:hypothetical protein
MKIDYGSSYNVAEKVPWLTLSVGAVYNPFISGNKIGVGIMIGYPIFSLKR